MGINNNGDGDDDIDVDDVDTNIVSNHHAHVEDTIHMERIYEI